MSLNQNRELIAYVFLSETFKTRYLLSLFVVVVVLSQFQVSKCPTSSFGFSPLQNKLLQNCTFAKPDTINNYSPEPNFS